MNKLLLTQAVRYLSSGALVAVLVALCRFLHANASTAGFAFLLAVLVVSAAWGLRCAIFLSVVATLAYNFYFLPPIGTFTIADPQNWIALFTFLLTAVIASQLSERARRETINANSRRRELEQLYAFSQHMLTADNVLGLLNAIPIKVVETFGADFAGMYSIHSKKVTTRTCVRKSSSPARICSGSAAAASRSMTPPRSFASGLFGLASAPLGLSP